MQIKIKHKTAVGYCRFSSDMQREESIEAQQEAISRYAERENIEIIRWYIDRAKSGKSDDRPEFLQMISDLKKQVIAPDMVLHHKIDRYFRNRYEAVTYRKEIRRLGIKIIAVAQPLDPENRPEDIIMESLLDGMAEYYSVNLRFETLKGMNMNARKCRFNGGWAPFGFKINEDGYYEIIEEEAPAVRTMFQMAMERRSYREISDWFDTHGYRTRQGRKFTPTTIHEMLQNPKYCGIYIFCRAPRRIDGKRNWRSGREGNPEAIKIEDGIPAIVSKEVFYKVQEILKERKKGPRPREREGLYLLTGKVFCGDCGSVMVGTSQRREKGSPKHRYYQCQGKKRRLTSCSNHLWPKDVVEKEIMKRAQRILSKSKELVDTIYEKYVAQEREKQDLRTPLEKEIRGYTEKINRLLDLVEQGSDIPDITSRINDLSDKRHILEHQLSQVKVGYYYTKTHFVDYFNHLLATVNMSTDDHCAAKRTIERLIERIDLHPDDTVKVLFKFNLDYLDGVDKSGAGSPTFYYPYTFTLERKARISNQSGV